MAAIKETPTAFLSAEDLAELAEARTRALRHFVQVVLAQPTFKPIGLPTTKPMQQVTAVEARRQLQAQRRKRALALVEAERIKKRKVASQFEIFLIFFS